MPVVYDDNGKVIRPNIQHRWTNEMVVEYAKCAKSARYFILNHCKVPHPTKGVINLELRDYQMRLLDTIDKNNRVVVCTPRQIGKSTIVSLYILWYSMFSTKPVYTFILGDRAATSQGILGDVKVAYEEMEPYLKKGVIEYNKTSVEFDNRSTIKSGPTTKKSLRSESITFLLLDEFAHVPPHIAEEFYEAAEPTVPEDGKMIIVSTPKGNTNLFHDIFSGAKLLENNNGFVPFSMDWKEVPGRDEAFKEKKIKAIGMQSWYQEYEARFLGSSNTLVCADALDKIGKIVNEPIKEFENWKCWETPKKNHIYVLGCDVAKGTEGDNSAIQILDITNKQLRKQVACYVNNLIDPFDFADKIHDFGKMYNNGYIIVENNTYGHEITRRLYEEHEYENLFKERKKKVYGVTAGQKTKAIATSLMKKYIEENTLVINDKNTFHELCGFVEIRPEIYKCDSGKNSYDDRVMALVWACYFLASDFWREWEEYIRQEIIGRNEMQPQQEQKIEEYPIDFGQLLQETDRDFMDDNGSMW